MIKKILSYVKSFKIYAILSPLFVTLEVIMDILIPYTMSVIVDKGIILKDRDVIIKTGILLIVYVLISFAAGITSGYLATKASAGLSKNLREALYKKIQSFSFKDIDSFSKGSLVTRLTTDVQNIQMSFQMSIRIAIRSPIMLIFAFIMAFRINRNLAGYFLFIIPVVGLFVFYIMMSVYPIFKQIFKGVDRLNTFVSENLLGIRVVKSHVREEEQIKGFTEISKFLYEKYIYIQKRFMALMPFMNFSIYTICIIISWVGSKFVVGGSLTTGQLMSLVTYSFQIQISLMVFAMVLSQIILSRNSADRIIEVLDKEVSLKSGELSRPVEDYTIEFKDVCFSYDDENSNEEDREENRYALCNINLKINPGENLGIIGGTGSSKSTLVQLIPRLYDVSCGSVEVGGVDVRDYDLRELRDLISMVLQKNQLFSGTVRSNLNFGDLAATDEEMYEALKIADAYNFIMEKGGLDTKVERGGSNFSGGQKQRLTIARSLLKKPKILILDDSTSALDTKTERNITESLKAHLPHMTRIIISQRVNTLKYCDRIVVMNEGRIESIGTHEELLKKSKIYSEISTSQERTGDFDEEK